MIVIIVVLALAAFMVGMMSAAERIKAYFGIMNSSDAKISYKTFKKLSVIAPAKWVIGVYDINLKKERPSGRIYYFNGPDDQVDIYIKNYDNDIWPNAFHNPRYIPGYNSDLITKFYLGPFGLMRLRKEWRHHRRLKKQQQREQNKAKARQEAQKEALRSKKMTARAYESMLGDIEKLKKQASSEYEEAASKAALVAQTISTKFPQSLS